MISINLFIVTAVKKIYKMDHNKEFESEADVNPFNLRPNNSRFANKESVEVGPKVKFDPKSLFYDMSGEKYLFVFNHYEYDAESIHYYSKPPKKRTGTDKDVKALEDTFSKLGFKIEVKDDMKYNAIRDILTELQRRDYSTASCLCVAILTHGTNAGELYAYDAPYNLKDVTKTFEKVPTLAGKPKLFFVQACRGDNVDDGNRIGVDGDDKNYFVMPSHADFLIVRSTVEDYMSFRDNRGSWLIQELCKAIQKYHQDLDILHILTLVHQEVVYNYKTYTLKKATRDKRQMPETTYSLTKILKF